MDILIDNEYGEDYCGQCGRGHREQHLAYPTPNGGIAFSSERAEKFFSEEDKAWAREESKRLQDLSEKYPEFRWYLEVSMDTRKYWKDVGDIHKEWNRS
jgi:hypothetical protein